MSRYRQCVQPMPTFGSSPADGMYSKRSPIIVPTGNRTFDLGGMAWHQLPPVTMAATAIQRGATRAHRHEAQQQNGHADDRRF